MKWTTKIPKIPGYYWWRCGVEKEVLRITKSDLKKSLFAEGGEYAFEVEPDGESEWCYIPEPE
jgi:hypothetical protein